jgi:hypothetical protein
MTPATARRRRGLACAGVALAVLLAPAPSPAAADVGDLTVHSGALPDGTPVTVGPWVGLNHNAPGGAGAYGVVMPPAAEGWVQTATLSPPANLTFRSATVTWRTELPVSGDHSQPQAETTWVHRGWPYTPSPYGGYNGDSAAGTSTAADPSHLAIRVACVGFDSVAGSCGAGGSFVIERGELVLHDDDAPLVTGTITGPLLDGTWQTSPAASITVTASDLGSGVYRAFLRTAGQTFHTLVDPAATRCRDARPTNGSPYDFVPSALTLVPCATAPTTYTPTFDLTALGDGVHLVSVGIEDAGGNERTVLTNRTLRINAPGGALGDPGTPCAGGAYDVTGACQAGGGGGGAGGAGDVTPAPVRGGGPSGGAAPPAPAPQPPAQPVSDGPRANGQNASTAASLTVRAGASSGRRVVVPYGRPATVTGRLTGRGGTPIAGAEIELSALARGRAWASLPGVVTGADGTFRATIPSGPSRTVRFAYRAFAGDADHADTAELEMAVRSAVRMRATPRALRNGAAVRFRGRVAGAPAGSRKVVEMQVFQEGRWLTFGTTRLRHGRFAYRYRFTRTVRHTRYPFRAIVRSDGGWPYETGASRTVTVGVRP